VAEGVETETQWSLLERLRCPLAQGFLLARPLLEADVPRLLLAGAPSCGLSAAG
jgi:EAL domain-containing protein (putative c-di-GMP-specific phosphodiesterase class I)